MGLASGLVAQVKRHPVLHRWALRAWSLRHPPPYRRPNMEFEFDAWNAISSLRNQVGRQLGEDNTGPYPYRQPTQNRYESCPFKDSRHGLPMNVTNLRLVMPDAADAHRLVTELRNRYIAQRGLAGPRLDLVQAYLFSKFAVSLPAYLTRRRDRPVREGELQALETAFYMLGTAPFMMVRQLMVRGDRRPLQRQPLDAEGLYRLADESGVLISTRCCACPASPKLIIEFFDVIMNGGFQGPLESAQVTRVLDTVGDWDRFYAYALAASRLELLVKLDQALVAQALLALPHQEGLAGTPGQALHQQALEQALARSHLRVPPGGDLQAAAQTVVDVLQALLQDHDEQATLAALAVGRHAPQLPALAAGAATARRIRQQQAILLEACRRNLHAVQHALGQPQWPDIGADDLQRRSAGPALGELLAWLEASAPRAAVQAA